MKGPRITAQSLPFQIPDMAGKRGKKAEFLTILLDEDILETFILLLFLSDCRNSGIKKLEFSQESNDGKGKKLKLCQLGVGVRWGWSLSPRKGCGLILRTFQAKAGA